MLNKDMLKAGDKIELLMDKGRRTIRFVSKVEDIEDENTFTIASPISEGEYTYVPLGKITKVVIIRDDGLYYFNAQTTERIKDGMVYFDRMSKISGMMKLQRRSYYRLKIILPVKICYKINKEEKEMDLYTSDISGGGMKFMSPDKIDKKTKLKITINIPELDDFDISASVIRCIALVKDKTKMYEIGTEYTNIDRKRRERIIRYIFKQQRIMLKNRKF